MLVGEEWTQEVLWWKVEPAWSTGYDRSGLIKEKKGKETEKGLMQIRNLSMNLTQTKF